MDFEKLLGIVRRHWFAVLAVLIVTVVAALQVPGRVEARYEVSGNVILLSPATIASGTGEDVDVNPWSRFGTAESGAATAMIAVLTSGATEALVYDDAAVELYTVAANQGNGAIIDLSVTALTPSSALSAYDLVLDLLRTELADRQEAAGAAESTWLSADVLTQPDEAEEVTGSATRTMLAVGGLGAVAAVCLAIALDTLVTPRRNRGPRRSRRERRDERKQPDRARRADGPDRLGPLSPADTGPTSSGLDATVVDPGADLVSPEPPATAPRGIELATFEQPGTADDRSVGLRWSEHASERVRTP